MTWYKKLDPLVKEYADSLQTQVADILKEEKISSFAQLKHVLKNDLLSPERMDELDSLFKELLFVTDHNEIPKEHKKEFELTQHEKKAWSDFLGKDIDIPNPPQELLDFLKKKEEERVTNLEAHFWPGDTVQLTQDADYPGWSVKPEEWYWKGRAEGSIPENPASRHAYWAVIDVTRKPEYDHGRQMYKDDPFQLEAILTNMRANCTIPQNTSHNGSRFGISWNDLHQYVLPEVARRERVDEGTVQLPTAEQFNVWGNMHHPEWGETRTYEWFSDKFGSDDRLVGGRSVLGGLAYVRYWYSAVRIDHLGFRPLVAFPSES